MTKRVRFIASAVLTLSVIGAFALAPRPARAADAAPPPVPSGLKVQRGNRVFLVGHAVGTQNYVCLPSAAGGFAWNLFTPEATLFVGDDTQLTTHFFGPNPAEGGTVRAAWQHSGDTSTVWARLSHSSSDAAFVAPNAIPWLLLEVVGTKEGPGGGETLTATTFIQRLNTSGGVAPATGCAAAQDVGAKAFVPYTADYFFFTSDDR